MIFWALAGLAAAFVAVGTALDLRAHTGERIGRFTMIPVPARVLNVASVLALQVAFQVLWSVHHRSYRNATTLAIGLPVILLVVALLLVAPRLLHNRWLPPPTSAVPTDEPVVDAPPPEADGRVRW
jgi:hypothetical protein